MNIDHVPHSTRRAILGAVPLALAAVPLAAPSATAGPPPGGDGPGRPIRPQPPDRELRRLPGEVGERRIRATVLRPVAFGTRHTLSSQTDPARGIGAARDWLLAQFRAVAAPPGGRMTVAARSFEQPPGPRNPQPVTVTNVVAILRGTTSPDRVHVVSGHYDSRITAETAAQAATRQSVGGENGGPSRQLARFVAGVADNDATGMRIRVVHRRDRFLRGSDHIPFLQQGYPAARFTEPRENFDHEHQDVRVENGHQFGDLPEFCDFAYTARVARVNAAALWSLAQAPGAPSGAGIVAAVLTNDTTLRWTRGPEPDLAGYELVWRESTAPDWTHVVPVGDVTTATIAVAEDNVHVGVRAVDRDGHRSPVSYPVPLTT